jgi:glycine/D-amino acid oxidase-like deaminating enzyme
MDYPTMCRAAALERIRTAPYLTQDQRKWLSTHERLNKLVIGLSEQFKLVDKFDHRFRSKPLTRSEIDQAARDFTDVWAKAAIQERDELLMSDAAKKALVSEATNLKLLRDEADKILEGGDDERIIKTDKGEISKQIHRL